ncbi:MAG: hypothetical protein AB8G11_02160 [Saprospiraceae bacterium]
MEIAVFEPISTGDETLFGIIVFCAIACLGIGIWGWKAKNQIAWMLGFFGVVILGGNAAFMKFSESYVTPVVIYENNIDTPNGRFSYNEIVAAKIQTEGVGVRKRALSNEVPEKVLLLERKDGKGIMLAESQYPIMQIKEALDKQMEAFYKK